MFHIGGITRQKLLGSKVESKLSLCSPAYAFAKQDDGTVNLIEMQRYYHDYMPERFLAELASKYANQAHIGKTMSESARSRVREFIL